MIEKLKPQITEKDGGAFGIIVERKFATGEELQDKINELIDAVNVLQAQVAILEEHTHPTAKTEPADPHAKQQEWVGKLCRFWDNDGDETCFSILEHIDKNSPYMYCASGDWWYKHCKPVNPDSDIIYKGEQQ